MQFIGKSKIGKLSAKKDSVYAQIRLPSKLADTIGRIADIFETKRDGKRAFLLVTNQSVLANSTVLQLDGKVVKPEPQIDYDKRLKDIESEIRDLKASILENDPYIDSKSKNKGPSS